jgi:chromosome segregation and condensation protein ScpB
MRVHLNRPTDMLTRDGEVILLHPDEVIRLDGVSAAIVALAGEPIGLEELAGELETLFGAPEHASILDATAAAAQELGGRGVLLID